ncbi:hypothetical protein [Noviherbaspirillum autotrophicum]|uniref:hypothetical protein n=1 Tax=Noviherbaspirillum autotrophicum TaxID=709839 RepID=UPI0012FDA972|nr:hypothetical protein [Noviherbaspirillum autotrophicum]
MEETKLRSHREMHPYKQLPGHLFFALASGKMYIKCPFAAALSVLAAVCLWLLS